MSAILFEHTSRTLTRELQRWDRRLRLTRSALWGPRGVIAGMAVGVVVALVSRVRPWLLPEQIAWATGLFTVGVLVAMFGWLWLRPRQAQRVARYFDRRFSLQERTSTALEMTGGTIPAPPVLIERQLADAVRSAQSVNVSARLPVRVRWLELAVMVALAVLFVALLLTHNPQSRELLAQRALEQAIANQAASLEQQIEAIERNNALTPEEQEALRQPLQEALEILQQPDISQQEAVAALSEAQQELRELSDGMLEGERQSYRQAAQALAGSEATSDLAEALNRPDLGAAADAAEQAAGELGSEMSAADREALAEQLEQAAEALEESNPALAEQLREAAQALREGDLEAAQEAMREAAESLREQQEQLDESEMAEQAQQAEQEVREGQQQVAEAGQDSGEAEQAQSGQQNQQPGTSAQQSQQSQQLQQSQAGQQSQQSQEGQQGDSSQQAMQSGETSGGQESEGEQSEGASQPGESGQGQQSEGSQAGQEGQAGNAPPQGAESSGNSEGGEATGETGSLEQQGGVQANEGAPGAQQSGDSAQAPGSEQSAAPAAGQGEGGAGVDTTEGSFGPQNEISGASGSGSADSAPRPFDPEFASSSIGGESDSPLDVGGQLTNENTIPSQEGDFAENPAGQSRLAYQSVLGDYQGFISDALESGRIPLTQRDVIHDYFSSLEP